jgi:hypothetical protein
VYELLGPCCDLGQYACTQHQRKIEVSKGWEFVYMGGNFAA